MINLEKPSLEELMHFGVKGMKWGHRKPQTDTPDPISEKEKKDKMIKNIIIGASVAAAALAVLGTMYVHKKQNIPIHIQEFKFGTKIDLSTLATKDTIISKGSKMYRMSSKSFEDYTTEGKHIYASVVKKDSRIYKEIMPKYLKEWGRKGIISDNGKNAYEHVMQAKTDIKIPSKKIIAEAYMKASEATEIDSGRYTQFMSGLADHRDRPRNTIFFDHLRSLGYNAIVDENDAGILSKMPLILLNPKEVIESSKVHKVGGLEKIINVLLL